MKPHLMIELNHEELNALQLPIIVEQWKQISCGKGRRAYQQEFSEPERRKVRALYLLGYDWYLRKGTPQRKLFKPSTIEFIERVVNFFATV